jgi:parallel beta-helix repeat protein
MSNEKVLIGNATRREFMRGSLIIISILILILGFANAAKITVGPTDANYSVIQQAADNASTGDLIEVQSGTYHENVYLFHAVTLQGVNTGNGTPVVDAGGSASAITLISNGTTVSGFNLTNSGHCGCGNAGVLVESDNNTIKNNIILKNKYGIYVRPGKTNNTFLSNDLVNNQITVNDTSLNHWSEGEKSGGLLGLFGLITGTKVYGNHYSDYDKPSQGCNDTNNDGFCDAPRKIGDGPNFDKYPSISPLNI